MTLCICNQAKTCKVRICTHKKEHARLFQCMIKFRCKGPSSPFVWCKEVEEKELLEAENESRA